MPTAPGFLAGIDLNGPYDADIPIIKVNQIKTAARTADWAVPYIFLSVASRFEADGDEKRTMVFYDRAIQEFRRRKNGFGEGTAWCRKVAALQRFGNHSDAVISIADMEAKIPGKLPAAFAAYSLGHYHFENGDYAKSIEYYRRALEINQDFTGSSDLIALRRDTELECGMALIRAGYFPAVAERLFSGDLNESFYRDVRLRVSSSLSHLEKAQSLNAELTRSVVYRYFPEIIPSCMECDVQNYLGLAFGIQGDTGKALDCLEKAGNLARHTGYHLGKADGLFFLNQIYLLSHNEGEGKKAAYSLQNIADQYRLLPYAVWSKIILAHQSRLSGDIDSALKFIHEFLDLMDNNASRLYQIADFRGTGHFKVNSICNSVFDLYVRKGDIQNAFKTSERIKAGPLVEAFREVVWTDHSPEGRLLGTMQASHDQAIRIYRRLVSSVNASPLFLKTTQSAERVEKDISNHLSTMKNQFGGLYALMYFSSPEARDVQRKLDHNTTLFSYYSTGRILYVWVISQNGIHMERINISGAEIEKFVGDYHHAMMSKDKKQIDSLSEKAYDTFLKPVIPFIHGDRIIFIPHGALCQFSFATMRYMKSYLADVFSILYLPHAGMINRPMSKTAASVRKQALIVAGVNPEVESVPDRTVTRLEALKRIYPQADYVTPSGNPKEALKKQSGYYNIIHFTAECYLSSGSPLGSGFLLSSKTGQGGYLSIADLLGLSVQGRVSVIDTCLKDNVQISSSSSQAVLIESLLYSASSAVVIPLWRVDEKSGFLFWEYFQKHLDKSDDVADALKTAQNEMIQSGIGPSDWAPFILFGRD